MPLLARTWLVTASSWRAALSHARTSVRQSSPAQTHTDHLIQLTPLTLSDRLCLSCRLRSPLAARVPVTRSATRCSVSRPMRARNCSVVSSASSLK